MVDPVTEILDRLVESAASMFDLMSIALGDRLGYYACLAANGPLVPDELAALTSTHPRYAREWIEQQAATGLVVVDGEPRRYALAPGVAAVFAEPDELSYFAPLARQMVAIAALVPAVADAYRSGGGVPWVDFGADMRESEAALNRPGYLAPMGGWLATMPEVYERLSASGARIADVGCGGGWSAIGLARAFPQALVDGFDLDPNSVELAQANARAADVGARVRMHCADIGEVADSQGYDLVSAFECLHDMPYPVTALAAMRRLARKDGTVLIVDMKVAETPPAPGDLIERLMYGFSITTCLPDSMASPDSSATGTVMRPAMLRDYAKQAGFTALDVLDVEHDLWRFYRLQP